MRSDFPLHARLTAREREVLHRLLRGLSVAAISSDLAISVTTGRMHLRNLHAKANTKNLHALALWSITHYRCCIDERGTGALGPDDARDDIARLQRLLLDSMSQALIATDSEGRVTAWNIRAEQLYGWSEEEALGRPIYDLTVLNASEEQAREIMATLARGEAWSGEFEATRRDRSTFTALVRNAPIIERGKFIGAIGLSEDVTEQRVIQQSIHELTREKLLADDRLWRVTHYDELTGLPNRALLWERLGQALATARRGGRKLAVHSIDFDHFDRVNKALGYAAGDRLLRLGAERLASTVRDADVVARFSADEFVVVQVGVAEVDDTARASERFLAALASPFEIDGEEWRITASCGIAVYPDHGDNAADLYQAAHSAMYAAKAAGRCRAEFSKPEFGEGARDGLEIATQLQNALDDHAIGVAFQPIVRAIDGAVVGVEALARFVSPTRGPVAPDVFIPIAESGGMIIPLSQQVRSVAFGWLRRWLDAGHDLALNVNASALVFRDEGFEEQLHRDMVEYGLPPSRVCLEITESTFIDEHRPTLALLDRLRAEGYGVAVDDFGKGFSMLASLRQPSLTSLKLDHLFVSDLDTDRRSHAVARFAIAVGQDLGLTVVAEGVETEGQYRFLREAGIDECQGYLFARPMPGEEVAAFLASWDGSRGRSQRRPSRRQRARPNKEEHDGD